MAKPKDSEPRSQQKVSRGGANARTAKAADGGVAACAAGWIPSVLPRHRRVGHHRPWSMALQPCGPGSATHGDAPRCLAPTRDAVRVRRACRSRVSNLPRFRIGLGGYRSLASRSWGFLLPRFAARITLLFSGFIGLLPAALLDVGFYAALTTVGAREVLAAKSWNIPMLLILLLFALADAADYAGQAGLIADVGWQCAIALIIVLISIVGGRIIRILHAQLDGEALTEAPPYRRSQGYWISSSSPEP